MPQADFTSNESQYSDTKPAMKVCTSVHRPQYVNRRRDLECFNGTNGIDVEDWVEDVKEHLSGTGYDAEYMAEFVRDLVMVIAKRELRARKLCKPGVEVSDMYDALISTFGNLGDEDMALETFYSRSQETDESILELSLSQCGLWDKVGNDKGRDKALKARLTGAVNDKGLGQELRRLQLEQPLLRFILFLARAIAWVKENKKISKVIAQVGVSGNNQLGDQRETVQSQIDKLTVFVGKLTEEVQRDRESGPSRFAGRCWVCGALGHRAVQCERNGQVRGQLRWQGRGQYQGYDHGRGNIQRYNQGNE